MAQGSFFSSPVCRHHTNQPVSHVQVLCRSPLKPRFQTKAVRRLVSPKRCGWQLAAEAPAARQCASSHAPQMHTRRLLLLWTPLSCCARLSMGNGGGFETASAPPPPVSDAERLARAKGYPYPRPNSSFVYVNGQTYEFDDSQWMGAGGLEWLETSTPCGELSIAQVLKNHNTKWELTREEPLTPVLAVGSNAAPDQLARKFPQELFPEGVVIPVLRCVLPDFDVVYAPLISSYGSCTATLEYSPGSAVAIFVTYLQPKLLKRMDETEGAYNLCELTEVQLQIALGLQDYKNGKVGRQILGTIYQYNHQHGSLNLPVEGFPQNVPIAIKEIAAVDRVFPALDQQEMQLACKHVLHPVTSSMDNDPSDTNGADHVAKTLSPAPLPMAAAAGTQIDAESNGAADGSQLGNEQPIWLQSRDELDPWVLQNLRDGDRRLRMVQALTELASPFRYGASRVVRALGNLFSENVS